MDIYGSYILFNGEEHIFVFVQDITERKRTEEQIRRLNAELEERVEQRTRELATSNVKLRQTLATLEHARDELVRSEKLASLGSLVAGVAHEFSTPLGNSLTVATTLSDKVRTFEAELHAGDVRRSSLNDFIGHAEKAARLLTRNLLKASELVSHFKQVAVDQTSAQRRKFDLAEVIRETLETLQPRFKRTPHRLELQAPAGLLMDSFPGPLGQVITNLVLNALIHGFDETRPGTVKVHAMPLPHQRVRIVVADDGRGIASEHLSRIFDPFFTTRLGQGGSGLGLHIIYTIVTRVLCGQIDVDSGPGRGAVFTVEIPMITPQQADATTRGTHAYAQSEKHP